MKTRALPLIALTILLLPRCVDSPPEAAGPRNGAGSTALSTSAPDTMPLYGIWELRVSNSDSQEYKNPFDFREVELRGVFRSPVGEQSTFFGFYDGNGSDGISGNVWRMRFMPDEPGTWTYRYRWTDGTPGGEGRFLVVDTGLPGPLRPDRDASRFFETARGVPFHFRGYDLHVIAPYTPSGSLAQELDRIRAIFDSVSNRGFNFTMLDGPIGRRTSDPNVWKESWWDDGKLRRFDVRTWHAFEEVLRAARDRGIYVTTFAGMVYQGEQYPFKDFQLFLRYWVARLAPFYNFLGYSPTWEWTDIWSPAEVDRIMSYVREITPFPVPLSAHDCSHSAFRDWLTFSMRQSQSRSLFGSSSRRSGQQQGRCDGRGGVADPFVEAPILGTEDIWETVSGSYGHPRNPTEVQRAAWGEMMAGVLPLYSEWHPNPPPAGGEGDAWPEMKRMFDFWYGETRYRSYVQLDNFVSGSARQVAAGIPGEEYLVYDEDSGPVTLDLSAVAADRRFNVLWYDPATGERQTQAAITGGKSVTLQSPLTGDSVLLLRIR